MGRIEGALRIYYLASFQGLIAIIHRAVLTAGPIVTILALKPSWLGGYPSVSIACSDDYNLFDVQAVVHQGQALPE